MAPMATDRVVLVATGNGHALSNSSRVVTGTPSKPGADPGATDFPRHSTPKDSKAQVTPVMLTPGGGHKVLSPVGRGVMTPDSHPGGEEGGKGPPGAPSAVTPVSTYSTVLLPWLALSRKDLEGSPSDLDYPGEAGQVIHYLSMPPSGSCFLVWEKLMAWVGGGSMDQRKARLRGILCP